MKPMELAMEIIDGRRLTRSDAPEVFFTCDLQELCEGADRIRAHYMGNTVHLCTILSGKSGRCSENCKFCAQSAFHDTHCEIYDLLDTETIFARAKSDQEEGVERFAIVNSGKGPTDAEFSGILEAVRKMHEELEIGLCCSIGFLTAEQYARLREAGVTRIHCNLETSRRFFPMICTTHTFEQKVENIRRAQAAGLHVCSGGIIGMGETWQDRLDWGLTLAELGVDSIPVNSLMPIPGTPFESLARLTEEEILRTIAMLRYLNPTADVRLAGGRALMEDHGRKAFTSGANASITGNMLTTSGFTIQSDRAMFRSLGRTLVRE